MGWLKKKPDPVSDRARALSAEIAALEEQIQRLNTQVSHSPQQPKLRPAALPHSGLSRPAPPPPEPLPPTGEPIFEDINKNRLKAKTETVAPRDHFNELGVRKYDLVGLWQRIKNHIHGPPTSNPRLVNYLAAGGVQGLRPMRYEKRVARNRTLLLIIVLFGLLLGIVAVFLKH